MSMLGENLCLFSHNFCFAYGVFTQYVVDSLVRHELSAPQVAGDLGQKIQKVRNWYYRSTRIAALDLLCLQARYDFIQTSDIVTYDRETDLFTLRCRPGG